jgi:hypothetical protein
MEFVQKEMKVENVEYSEVRVFRGNNRVDGGWVKTALVNELVDFIRKEWKEILPKAKLEFYVQHYGKQVAGGSILEYVKK